MKVFIDIGNTYNKDKEPIKRFIDKIMKKLNIVPTEYLYYVDCSLNNEGDIRSYTYCGNFVQLYKDSCKVTEVDKRKYANNSSLKTSLYETKPDIAILFNTDVKNEESIMSGHINAGCYGLGSFSSNVFLTDNQDVIRVFENVKLYCIDYKIKGTEYTETKIGLLDFIGTHKKYKSDYELGITNKNKIIESSTKPQAVDTFKKGCVVLQQLFHKNWHDLVKIDERQCVVFAMICGKYSEEMKQLFNSKCRLEKNTFLSKSFDISKEFGLVFASIFHEIKSYDSKSDKQFDDDKHKNRDNYKNYNINSCLEFISKGISNKLDDMYLGDDLSIEDIISGSYKESVFILPTYINISIFNIYIMMLSLSKSPTYEALRVLDSCPTPQPVFKSNVNIDR